MNITEDLTNLDITQPSLCIPRVFYYLTESRIREVFDDLGLGKLNRVDLIDRRNERGEVFKLVYIHFEKWYWNEQAQYVRKTLIAGKEVKIVYEFPLPPWKVSASRHISKEKANFKKNNIYMDLDTKNTCEEGLEENDLINKTFYRLEDDRKYDKKRYYENKKFYEMKKNYNEKKIKYIENNVKQDIK